MPPTLAEMLSIILEGLFQLMLLPFRVMAWLQDCARDSTADDLDQAYADVREATARVDADDGRQPVEHLPDLARRFLAGETSADICRLPRRQQAWLHAARASGVDVTGLTDSDLVAHVRGRHVARGLDPLVDEARLLRVRQAVAASEADRAWEGTAALALGF